MSRLIIAGIPPNLNKYRNMHYQKLNDEKKMWEKVVYVLVREQKLQPVRKAIMTYHFHFTDKQRHDPDNYACCAKFIQDALVSAGILIDDSFDYVQELRIKQGEIRKSQGIEIEIEEVS